MPRMIKIPVADLQGRERTLKMAFPKLVLVDRVSTLVKKDIVVRLRP